MPKLTLKVSEWEPEPSFQTISNEKILSTPKLVTIPEIFVFPGAIISGVVNSDISKLTGLEEIQEKEASIGM